MKYFLAILERDINLTFNKKGGVLQFLAFFLIIVTLFPLSVSNNTDILKNIAPAIILIAVMLVNALYLPSIFENDEEEGVLQQYLLFPCIPQVVVLAKLLAHWLKTSVPLIFVTPLLSLMLGLEGEATLKLVYTLILATPTICSIGYLTAALSLGLNKSSLLLSIISIPLYIPVLVFSSGANIAENNSEISILLLISLIFISVPVSIIAASYNIKNYSN